jgi:putative sterol carrier protein
MAIEFGTDAWIKELQVKLNESEGYREAAKNWEGDFYFVITAGPGIPQDIHLYVDLWHGECRDAFRVEDASEKNPEFAITAPLTVWRKVVDRKLDPIQGLMTRQLKLKGNMFKVMKAPKAAQELVHCCTLVDTSWPSPK